MVSNYYPIPFFDIAKVVKNCNKSQSHRVTEEGCWMLDAGCWMLDIACHRQGY